MQVFIVEIKWKSDHPNWDTGVVRTKVHRRRAFITAADQNEAKIKAAKIHEENAGKFWSNIPQDASVEVFGEGQIWSEPTHDEDEDET